MVPSNVNLVTTNVQPALDQAITVVFVPLTESVNQIVIVTSKMVIMKSVDKPLVQFVPFNVPNVLIMTLVSFVPLIELIVHQLVHVQMDNI